MRDLVTEAAQAALCADCHVGNLRENKFVTHAMYAAGHPPLPNFELQTFCDAMPQHWQTPDELYAVLNEFPQRDKYFATNYPKLFSAEQPATTPSSVAWRTRRLLIGGLEARRHWVQMIVDASESDAWSDYALYDCTACHHELRQDSARQQFADSSVPGRPRQLLWTKTLPAVAALQTRFGVPLITAEAALAEAFDARPFGDRDACGQSALQVLAALQQVSSQIETLTLEGNGPRSVLIDLTHAPSSQLVDYLTQGKLCGEYSKRLETWPFPIRPTSAYRKCKRNHGTASPLNCQPVDLVRSTQSI